MQRRKLVDNKWVTFLEDRFRLPNGADCTYYHTLFALYNTLALRIGNRGVLGWIIVTTTTGYAAHHMVRIGIKEKRY